MSDVVYVTMAEVIAFHQKLIAEEGQPPTLLIAPDKLEAAIMRPQASAFGEDAYATIAEKAAALLQAIVIGHPFADGNKRAGLAAMLLFLAHNGVDTVAPLDPVYDFVIAVTTGDLRDIPTIAAHIATLFNLPS